MAHVLPCNIAESHADQLSLVCLLCRASLRQEQATAYANGEKDEAYRQAEGCFR